MKKITTTKKEKDFYNIENIIDDVAIIKSSINGKRGLLDIKTNELIGELDYFRIDVDVHNKLFYQIKEKYNIINIYDIINKKFLAYHFDIVSKLSWAVVNYVYVYVLRSPIDMKIHLFDAKKCRDEDNIFHKQLKRATFFTDGLKNASYVLTDTNGKKALYLKGEGLLTKYEYDEIEKKKDVVIYTKDDEKSFSICNCDGISTSIIGKFKDIKTDKKEEQILYCEDDKNTSIYDLRFKTLILREPKDFECIAIFSYNTELLSVNYEYLFIATDKETKKKSLFGVLYDSANNEFRKKEIIRNYDAIKVMFFSSYSRIIALYLENEKKLDLFVGNFSFNKCLRLKSDKINYLGEDCYAVIKNEVTDILEVNPKAFPKIAIKNCTIKDKSDDAIIYSQKNSDGKEYEGIYYFENPQYHRDIYKKNVPAIYNKINRISHSLYLAEDNNNNKGIYYLGRLIIPIEFKDIDIAFSPKYSGIETAYLLYFSLKKEKSNILAKRVFGLTIDTDVNNKSEEIGEYKNILFLKDIIVLKTLLNTIVYDYNDKLLGEFPLNTTVTSFDVSNNQYNKKTFYCIDNDYYFYQNGNLEKYYKEDIDMYLTTYETDTEVFEASTYKKDVLDKFVSNIDSMEADLGETYLNKMFNNKRELETKYPSLVLRKVKKREVK